MSLKAFLTKFRSVTLSLIRQLPRSCSCDPTLAAGFAVALPLWFRIAGTLNGEKREYGACFSRRPPDYSSKLCPPKTFAIWFFRGVLDLVYKKNNRKEAQSTPKKSYSKCFRRTQIRWVIWRSCIRRVCILDVSRAVCIITPFESVSEWQPNHASPPKILWGFCNCNQQITSKIKKVCRKYFWSMWYVGKYLSHRGIKIRVFWACFRAPFLSPFFPHFHPLFPLQALFTLPRLLPSSPPPLLTKQWGFLSLSGWQDNLLRVRIVNHQRRRLLKSPQT